MPVRDGLPVSERRRHVPPRNTTTGPPKHPIEHRTVIGPPSTPTRGLVGQQRLHPGPLRIGQIVPMQHPPGLPHPALKIRGTRSRRSRMLVAEQVDRPDDQAEDEEECELHGYPLAPYRFCVPTATVGPTGIGVIGHAAYDLPYFLGRSAYAARSWRS